MSLAGARRPGEEVLSLAACRGPLSSDTASVAAWPGTSPASLQAIHLLSALRHCVSTSSKSSN